MKPSKCVGGGLTQGSTQVENMMSRARLYVESTETLMGQGRTRNGLLTCEDLNRYDDYNDKNERKLMKIGPNQCEMDDL